MLIPVCHITRYGNICGTIYYDNVNFKFIDTTKVADRLLPTQDYLECSTISSDICTVVGKNYRYNTYVVCFGDNFIYELTRDVLLTYSISNMKLTKGNRLVCLDGKLPDFSDYFPDRKLKFKGLFTAIQASSLGVARKFFAEYGNKSCIVKFSKRSDDLDLINEEKYYSVAKSLGVSCCKANMTSYYNKQCVVSIFSYNRERDLFKSFKSTGLSIRDIYTRFSDSDKNMFNKMMLLDFIMSQQDRHMSNIALCNNRLYPLFDNGECLGIGSISYFSQNFRRYILSLDKDYLRCLAQLSNKSISNISRIIGDDLFRGIVVPNLKELGLWDL